MTARLIGSFKPGSPEWHAARANGIGGSEIGAVLGLSPWESRFSLWHRKAGEVGPVEVTPQMEWGTRLEPVILAKYAENHPVFAVEARQTVQGTFVHELRAWQVANPDVWAPGRVVDAKFSPFGDGWGEPGTDEVPPHVRAQVVHYCDVLDCDRADLAVLVGGYDYREYTVIPAEGEAEYLREAGLEFLQSIELGIRPSIDEHSATYQTIRELHPDIDGTDVELSDRLVIDYLTAREQLEAAKAGEQLVRSQIAELMGNAKRARWDDTTIASRQAKGGGAPFVKAGRNLPAAADIRALKGEAA